MNRRMTATTRKIELSGLAAILNGRQSKSAVHDHDQLLDEDVLTLHEKAKMIVDDDDAFQKLKEDLRKKRVITTLGLNAVLSKCVDSRIEQSNLSLSCSERVRGTCRLNSRSSRTQDNLSGSERSRVFSRLRSTFTFDSKSGSKRGLDVVQSGTSKVFQKLQAAMHLEDEVVLQNNRRQSVDEMYKNKISNQKMGRRPSALRRSTFPKQEVYTPVPAQHEHLTKVEVKKRKPTSQTSERNLFQKIRASMNLDDEVVLDDSGQSNDNTRIEKVSQEKVQRRRSSALRRATYPRPATGNSKVGHDFSD